MTKLCECGCGEPTPLARWTDKRRGTVKGQPRRYCDSHNGQPKANHQGTRYIQLPCGCGCGELAPLHRTGWPQKYVSGHQNRGRYQTPRAPRTIVDGQLLYEIKECGYETPCWEWSGTRALTGYGCFTWNNVRYAAHRWSWEQTHGPIPDGMFVCHHCDNPPCIRPDHLFLGTGADNMHDMIAKGRAYQGERPWLTGPKPWVRGEKHPNSVITEQLAIEIYRRYQGGGISERALASQYGISRGVVRNVVTGRAWSWATQAGSKVH